IAEGYQQAAAKSLEILSGIAITVKPGDHEMLKKFAETAERTESPALPPKGRGTTDSLAAPVFIPANERNAPFPDGILVKEIIDGIVHGNDAISQRLTAGPLGGWLPGCEQRSRTNWLVGSQPMARSTTGEHISC
ncbi:MAG: hypothetical protein ACLP1Y_06350, partial [Candidatus Acidiferrales bacterium]